MAMGSFRDRLDPPSRGSREHRDRIRSERVLVERIRAGHSASLQTLLDRYWTPLVSYAFGIVDDRDVAQDVVQGAFIRVWNARESLPPAEALRRFLYAVTRNLSLNALREQDRREARQRRAADPEPQESAVPTPDEDYAEATLRRAIERAVSGLTPRRREVFVLSRFHGLSHSEIAETLGISPQTVANQVTAALEDLRTALADHLRDR